MEAQNKTLTQQEKAISLFEYIRELNKLKQKVVLNMKEYLLCRPLSELPDAWDRRVVFDTPPQNLYGGSPCQP